MPLRWRLSKAASFFSLSSASTCAACQALSTWALSLNGSSVTLFSAWGLSFARATNYGFLGERSAVLGALSRACLWTIILACFFVGGIYLWRKSRTGVHYLSLGTMAGAGASTVVDRIRVGGVVDYFLIHPPAALHAIVFNLPDVLIVTGASVLLFSLLMCNKKCGSGCQCQGEKTHCLGTDAKLWLEKPPIGPSTPNPPDV